MGESHASHHAHAFVHPPRQTALFGIEPGMKIADFGAGSGAYVLEMARALQGTGAVYAVDVQKDLLRRIANLAKAERLENVHIIWGDVEKHEGTKLKDGLLDLVLVSNLLFQLEHPELMFAEARRILKPGGRCVVIDWSQDAPNSVLGGPHRHHAVQMGKAVFMLEDAGFGITRELPAGSRHYCIVATRHESV